MTSQNKKALLIHAWMTGNIGDILHTRPIVSYLKERKYTIDICGYYPKKHTEWEKTLVETDTFYNEKFKKYISSKKRKELFSKYEKVIFVPGPYISNNDPRKKRAIQDIKIISEIDGTKSILAGHSFSNLSKNDFNILRKTDTIISRETYSWQYLKKNKCESILGSDLAFSYLNKEYKHIKSKKLKIKKQKKLCFLRHDNFKLEDVLDEKNKRLAKKIYTLLSSKDEMSFIEVMKGLVKINLEKINKKNTGKITNLHQGKNTKINKDACDFATSDAYRDREKLGILCKMNKIPYLECNTVRELVETINNYETIISDRYHPSIIAIYLNKDVIFLKSKNDAKMKGLFQMKQESVEELIRLSNKSLCW